MPKRKYKLQYFILRARGECCRWLLYQSGVDFVDERIHPDDWPALKPHTPLGTLPVLDIDDGKYQISNSMAVGGYLAREFDMAGKNSIEEATISMLAHNVADYHEAIIAKGFNKLVIPIFGTMDHRKAKDLWMDDIFPNLWTPHCDRFNQILKSNGGKWLVGNAVSWADIAQAEISDRMVKCAEKQALDDWPRLKDHMRRVMELPNIRAYRKKRKPPFEKDW